MLLAKIKEAEELFEGASLVLCLPPGKEKQRGGFIIKCGESLDEIVDRKKCFSR